MVGDEHQKQEGAEHSVPPNLREEDVYVGPYTLHHTLGKGTTGKVKLAVKHPDQVKMAIKIMRKDVLEAHSDSKHRVEREIGVLHLLRHPNIIGLRDIMQTDSHLFIVLEYLDRGELYDYVVEKRRLSAEESFYFFFQLVLGVEYMHCRNICHRDLKLENLLLDSQGKVKLADFGMASTMPRDGYLNTSCGSPHYACPEIVSGGQYKGVEADTWSMGVILFALLTGTLPFDDGDMSSLFEKIKGARYSWPEELHISPAVQDLVAHMLRVEGSHRITMEQIMQHPWWKEQFPKLSHEMRALWNQQRSVVATLKRRRQRKQGKRAQSVGRPAHSHQPQPAPPGRESMGI